MIRILNRKSIFCHGMSKVKYSDFIDNNKLNIQISFIIGLLFGFLIFMVVYRLRFGMWF